MALLGSGPEDGTQSNWGEYREAAVATRASQLGPRDITSCHKRNQGLASRSGKRRSRPRRSVRHSATAEAQILEADRFEFNSGTKSRRAISRNKGLANHQELSFGAGRSLRNLNNAKRLNLSAHLESPGKVRQGKGGLTQERLGTGKVLVFCQRSLSERFRGMTRLTARIRSDGVNGLGRKTAPLTSFNRPTSGT